MKLKINILSLKILKKNKIIETMCISINKIRFKIYFNSNYYYYIYNINKTKDIKLLQNNLIELFYKHYQNKGSFDFNALKIYLLMFEYRFKTIYSSNQYWIDLFMNNLKIKDNIEFISTIKENINKCDDFFVLYLFYHILEIKE